MKNLKLVLMAIQFLASLSIAGGRVVRGGGGFAEMQASYALNRVVQEMQICDLQNSCSNLTTSETSALKKLILSLQGKTLTLNYKPECTSLNPSFSFETFQFNTESCHLYNKDQKSLEYSKIFEIVFENICRAGANKAYTEKIDCHAIHEKLFLEISATNEKSTLYQSLDPIYINITKILSPKNSMVYFSIEYANSSYSLNDRLLAETNCENITDFKIVKRNTFVNNTKAYLYSDINIEWVCSVGTAVGSYSALLTLDNPILEKDFSDKTMTFFLSGIAPIQ